MVEPHPIKWEGEPGPSPAFPTARGDQGRAQEFPSVKSGALWYDFFCLFANLKNVTILEVRFFFLHDIWKMQGYVYMVLQEVHADNYKGYILRS